MIEDLQRTADGLARRLGRAVAIDDLSFRLLVYTSHAGTVDPVRAEVVLTREAPAEVAAWVRTFPIRRATAPVRIPANPELGLLPRLCVPIRCKGIHFGWLWLIDPDESLTDEEVALAQAAADEAGVSLFWEKASKEYGDARARELVRDLLADDAAVRQQAARELVDGDHFTANPGITVIVMRLSVSHAPPLTEEMRMGLAAALDEVAALLPPRESLRLARPDHALLLTRTLHLERQPNLPARLHELGIRALGIGEDALVVGIGPATDNLADVNVAYRRALYAAWVGEVVPSFRPVARFTELGAYGLLAELPLGHLGEDALHPGLARLRQVDDDLVVTLELFLDHAGDTNAVARVLGLHRSTVYHRLRRVEAVCDADLADGEDRLALHLSLKVERLTGAR